MFRPVLSLACATIAAVTSGCAAPSSAPLPEFAQSNRQCFRANQVYGYTPAPDGDVDISTAQGPFRVHLGSGCPDFSWIMQIGVRPVESSWLCEGRSDELITAFQTPFSRCPISGIHALAPAPALRAQAASGEDTVVRERFSAPAIPPRASSAPSTAVGVH